MWNGKKENKSIITVIRLILSITKTIAEIIDEFDEMIMKSNESIMKAFVERIDEINIALPNQIHSFHQPIL